MRRVALALAVVLATAIPAAAHTPEEQLAWLQRWSANAQEETPDRAALQARRGFLERHNIQRTERVDCGERRRCLELVYWPASDPDPEPESSPAPVLPSVGVDSAPAGVEQWRGLVATYFPADQVDKALAVMACESGGDPSAYNPSGASGLMQVMDWWAPEFGYEPEDLFVPEINVAVAYQVWLQQGWGGWSCA